jgi:hypothetical protein
VSEWIIIISFVFKNNNIAVSPAVNMRLLTFFFLSFTSSLLSPSLALSFSFSFYFSLSYTHMHTCICTTTCNYKACIHTYIHACFHTCTHAYIHTNMHSYIQINMEACIHTHIHAFIHTHSLKQGVLDPVLSTAVNFFTQSGT